MYLLDTHIFDRLLICQERNRRLNLLCDNTKMQEHDLQK